MKQVYTPANAAEAHMLAHLLGQNGIQAHVHGEQLTGAMGELPAGNLIQLLVADEDYDRARDLLMRWERSSGPADPVATPGKRFRFVAALVFLLVGIASGFALKTAIDNSRFSVGDSRTGLDQNGDGRDDATWIYHIGGGQPYRGEFDGNFDGRVDLISHYDVTGTVTEEELDTDYDGNFDSRSMFRNGVRVRTETDTDHNEVADVISYFQDGVVRRIEMIDHRYGHVVRIDHYGPFHLERSEADLDRDGFLETIRNYDRYGEVTESATRSAASARTRSRSRP